jgi:hypothetical protein
MKQRINILKKYLLRNYDVKLYEIEDNTKEIKTWFHPESPGLSADSNIVDKLFIDKEFIEYQSIKNLALIDAVSKSLNAKVIYSVWSFLGAAVEREIDIIQENFTNFQYIKYPDLKYDTDYARDSMHPGPAMHEKISEVFFEEYFKKEIIGNK